MRSKLARNLALLTCFASFIVPISSQQSALAANCVTPTQSTLVEGSTSYIVQTFTDVASNCDWTVPAGVSALSVVLVGGGGGAGFGSCGGGGGGGRLLLSDNPLNVSAGSTLSLTIGSGGAGGWFADQGLWISGTSGSASSITVSGTTYSASGGGGGGGGSGPHAGSTGGSGGGGTSCATAGGGAADSSAVSGFSTYANDGASGGLNTYEGGGGGGAGAAGSFINGGAGRSVWGVTLAGGGGGWINGVGGSGGGGSGGGGQNTAAEAGNPGIDGLGGGGGGGNKGGSGRIMLRYLVGPAICGLASGTTKSCELGDTGPGGGKVFYVSQYPFPQPGSACNTAGVGGTSICTVLEAAPAGWNGTSVDPLRGLAAARTLASSYEGNDSSAGEWFLPSIGQLGKMFVNRAAIGTYESSLPYGSASEPDNINYYYQYLSDGIVSAYSQGEPYFVRPVRAFSDNTLTPYSNFIAASAEEGSAIILSAPQGKVFGSVLFASYGTPENYFQGACHSTTSLSVVQALTGEASLVVSADNGVFDDPCGGIYKRLQVVIAYSNAPASPPTAPTLNSVTGGDRSLSLVFTQNGDGGSAITGYQYSLNGETFTATNSTTSPLLITPIAGRETFTVTIKAVNAIGVSGASESLTARTTDGLLDASEAATAEAARLAALAAEAARLAEIAEAERVAEAERIARTAEEARLQELERQRLIAEAIKAEEERIAAELKAKEEAVAKLAAELKAKEEAEKKALVEKEAAELKAKEEAEKKKLADEKKAADLKAAEAKAKAEAKAEEEKKAAEARVKAEEERKAEAERRAKAEEARQQEAARSAAPTTVATVEVITSSQATAEIAASGDSPNATVETTRLEGKYVSSALSAGGNKVALKLTGLKVGTKIILTLKRSVR